MTGPHRLLGRQLARATGADGATDLGRLSELVSSAYWEFDRERIRAARAHALMAEDMDALVARLEQQSLRFEAALDNMAQGLCLYDAEGRLVVHNRRILEMFRLPDGALRRGMPLADVVAAVVACRESALPEGGVPAETLDITGHRVRAVWDLSLDDGRLITITREPMADGGFVDTLEDVTERRRHEAQIAYLAHHDTLTGLPNRVLFRRHLEEMLAARDAKSGCALLCLDLDDFKGVNDTLGHPVGDALLGAVTQRLRDVLRQADRVARLGGDEFAIVQTAIDRPEDASALAARLVQELSEPYEVEGQHVMIGASIGVVTVPAGGGETDPDALLRNADVALYWAKADGRNCFRVFEASMVADIKARRQMESDLRQAVAAGEFEVHYQPQLNLRTRRISGFEALVRWNSPTRGRVPPDRFIPVAEATGLIADIGEWVLREACREAARWPGTMRVAVNLSAAQFRGSRDLYDTVCSALLESGLPPARLELEITESLMVEQSERILGTLRQLRRLGITIAMDDFGTGYSSLSYLRQFPFDKIKIDRSFVQAIGVADDGITIVRAVVAMCSSLGMTTVAEGVETEEQLRLLQAERCAEIQGYLIGRPLPAADLPALMQRLGEAAPA